MNKSRSPVHLVRIKKTHGQKVYTSVLLRHSIREGKKVRSETLANLSCLPEETVDLIELSLKGLPVGRLDQEIQVVRSLPHGHVAAVVGTMRSSGLTALLGSRRSRERDLQEALIAHRLLSPGSKLGLARALSPETATSTLGEVLGVAGATEDELYDAMDALLSRQEKIETALAQKHLQDGTLVLYDVSSSYYTGEHCDLSKYGHNRDGKKRFPQIVYGLLCTSGGCPVAIEVFEGNTADPATLESQIRKLRERFGLARVVLVTDRGILTQVQIEKVRDTPGFDWITSPDYPGERLIVCRNPVLADRRTWKREELLSATEKDLEKIVKAVQRPKNPLRGKDKIALRVGKHFELTFKDDRFTWSRNEEKIREEAALDGSLRDPDLAFPRDDGSGEDRLGLQVPFAGGTVFPESQDGGCRDPAGLTPPFGSR